MRVVITGGRDYDNYKFMDAFLEAFHEKFRISSLIEGGARGADRLAGTWANLHGIPRIICRADWNKHGKAAGILRNQQMIDEEKPDICIAFPGGRGTADMIRRCKKAGIRVVELDR